MILVSLAASLLACTSPGPAPSATAPAVVCEGIPAGVQVRGERFHVVVTDVLGDEPVARLPEVTLLPASGVAEGSPPLASSPVPVPPERVRWLDGRVLELDLGPEVGLAPGLWDLRVTNPDGEEGLLEEALLVLGPPRLDEALPGEACHALDSSPLQLAGEGFVFTRSGGPRAWVEHLEVEVLEGVDCRDLAGPTLGTVCSGLRVELPASALPPGPANLWVDGPPGLACGLSEPAPVAVVPPPELHDVDPMATCLDVGGTFTLEGSGFAPGTAVEVGGVSASRVEVLDESHLEFDLPASLGGGLHDVEVIAPTTCTAVLEEALEVERAPIAYLVEPASVWSGAATGVTVHLSDIHGEVTDAWLVRSDGKTREVPWSWDPARPQVVILDLPAGLAPGAWSVGVVQDEDCEGDSGGTVQVVDELTVAIDALEPPYAWTFDHTPVEVRARVPAPAGATGFDWVPRLYLVGPDGAAHPVRGLTWRSEALLTAVIPAGLDVGSYDVVVVNPDGAVGLLPGGLEILWEAPPSVDSVSPASLSSSQDEAVTIHGADFRDPGVAITCSEDGAETTLPGTVLSSTSGSIEAVLPSKSFNAATCVLEVDNADGTAARWSALSVRNPADNLFGWDRGPDLVEARRGPAAAAARTTSVSRWVYAIGGDDGDASGARDTVEVAPIGVYGEIGEWTLLPLGLPEPRTLAGAAVIERFVYVVGGNDGTGPTDSVLRAQVLDPLDVPFFEDPSLTGGEGTGLGGGTWTYRVAALFAADDPLNPGGESLAGESLALGLPDLPERLRPTLTWSEVDGAVGYRVYRSPTADAGPGSEAWVADVDSPRFTDTGLPADPSLTPLPEGSLGEWASLAPLSTPRESPCVAAAPDPVPDPELVWVYAAGGHDDEGVLDSLERLQVTVLSPAEQLTGPWTVGDEVLSEARTRCAGLSVHSAWHTAVDPGESWVYFAGGDDGERTTGAVDAGLVQAGGSLGEWQSSRSLSPARSGVSYASASNNLYVFGGHHGRPSGTGVSASLEGRILPRVRNWNSLSISLSEPRVLAGSAQESAVILVVGGETDDYAATRTTDRTSF